MNFFNLIWMDRAKCLSTAMIMIASSAPLSALGADLSADNQGGVVPVQDFDESRFGGFRQKLSDWNVVIGAGALYTPTFEGADDFKVVPVPLISATYGERIRIDTSGLTVDVLQSDALRLSITGGYEMGRLEKDSDHLRGLGDVDPGGVIGAKASYQFGLAEAYASLNKTIGGSDGMVGKVGGNLSYRYEQLTLSAGASATFADKNHMAAYFGVTPEQSANSGFAQYTAKAGLKRFDVEASVTYMATENWMVRGQLGAGFLTGDAKKSPIVQTDVQPSGMLLVGYKF